MTTIITLIICAIIWGISKASLEHRVDNYPISKVDSSKMAADAGKSYTEIRRNMVNGKYDKDK